MTRTKEDSACQKRATIDAFCCIVLHSFAKSLRERKSKKFLVYGPKLVLPDRIELSTSSLPMKCSTTELRQRTELAGIAAKGVPDAGFIAIRGRFAQANVATGDRPKMRGSARGSGDPVFRSVRIPSAMLWRAECPLSRA
jgi:hypothetical protein